MKQISGNEVIFDNGEKAYFDAIILCTGYKIDLDILHSNIKKEIFIDKEESQLNVTSVIYIFVSRFIFEYFIQFYVS